MTGWTREEPTEPGFYWVRSRAGNFYVFFRLEDGEWWYPGSNQAISPDDMEVYLPRLKAPEYP